MLAAMPSGERTSSVEALVEEMVDHLGLDAEGDRLVGRTPGWFGDVLFGGFVIAQAIAAATRDAPDGRRLHSLHAYFLRPVAGDATVSYRATVLREGRTFANHMLQAEQGSKPVLVMTSSFTTDTDGYDYDLGSLGSDVQPPHEADAEPGPGPWEACWVGPTEPAEDGSRTSTHRMWFRIPTALPDDAHLHTALLGFATDWTGIGGRPLALEGDTQGMVSLDHAVWFHRPFDMSDWLLYAIESPVAAGARGFSRGSFFTRDGVLVASVAQEGLVRKIGDRA